MRKGLSDGRCFTFPKSKQTEPNDQKEEQRHSLVVGRLSDTGKWKSFDMHVICGFVVIILVVSHPTFSDALFDMDPKTIKKGLETFARVVVDAVDMASQQQDEKCRYKCPAGYRKYVNHAHRATSNGCGSLGVDVDLSHLSSLELCCDEHDICYDTCNVEKEKCDNSFYHCLIDSCTTVSSKKKKNPAAVITINNLILVGSYPGMAVFDESGVPLELNQALRKLQNEIEDKRNVIATEKQIIAEIEKEIKDKKEASMKMDSDNQQLEMAIQHTSYIFEHQKQQKKMLQDTENLLREQVRSKEEIFERELENKSKILEECEAKYEEYKEKVQQRMQVYGEMPLVVELRGHIAEIEELQLVVETRKRENEIMQKDIEDRKAKRDSSKLKFKSITEWGVALRAKEMLKLRDVRKKAPENLKRVQKLRQKVKELERKKAIIDKEQEGLKQMEPTPMELPSSSYISKQRREKNKFQLKTMLPSFEGFFKKKPGICAKQAPGSSGSSLRSSTMSSSLPNIPSLFSIPVKSPLTKSTENLSEKYEKASPEKKGCKKMKTNSVESSPGSALQRSRSLSLLVPQVKPLKKLETVKSTSMLGKSLSDWLKQSPGKLRQQQKQKVEKLMPGSPQVKIVAEQPVSPNKPKISYEKSTLKWPQPPIIQPAPKVTEVPLIRQIQEKIIHKKALEQGEQLIQAQVQSEQNDIEEAMEGIEAGANEDVSTGSKTMLSFFDGPVYDVPMPSVEEDTDGRSIPSQMSSTPTTPEQSNSESTSSTPEMDKSIFDEHKKLLAEFEEMPGDDFRMAANYQCTGGDSASFLIGQKTPPSQTKKGDFQFAVPNLPGPGSRKKSKSPESQFFLGFGGQSSDIQATSCTGLGAEYGNFSETSRSPTSFSFGGVEEPSTSAGSPFSFGSNFGISPKNNSPIKSPIKRNKSPSSSFSFGRMFTGESKSSPSSDDGMFSFNFGKCSSDKEDQNLFLFGTSGIEESRSSKDHNVFSFSASEKEHSPSSEFLFSSAFGCQK